MPALQQVPRRRCADDAGPQNHHSHPSSPAAVAALECLAEIVEEGSFERAAQRLSITQSAVSQRLRSLEAQVGTVLLVRSRPLKLTPAGQLLIKHARMMRLLRSDLEHDLRELAPALAHRAREAAARALEPMAT